MPKLHELSTKPLVIGWVPTKRNVNMIANGNKNKLPGFWLYNLQLKHLPGKVGQIFGFFFKILYSKRKI